MNCILVNIVRTSFCRHTCIPSIFVNFYIVDKLNSIAIVDKLNNVAKKEKKSCFTEKRQIKVIQIAKFSQNREIYVSRNMRTLKLKKKKCRENFM